MTRLQPDALFECLDRQGVRYVLIGGVAAVLHGSPLPTIDADNATRPRSKNWTRVSGPRTHRTVFDFHAMRHSWRTSNSRTS